MSISPVFSSATAPQTAFPVRSDDPKGAQVPPSEVAKETNQLSNQEPVQRSSTGLPSNVDQDAVKEAVDSANEKLKSLQNQSNALEFSLDKDLGRVIVRLVDTKTKEVIRQYPAEEVLEIARQMDKLVGKLLKEKA